MQIVIDIPEETYQDVVKNGFIYDEDNEVISHSIINGTPLPKGHGELIDRKALINDGLGKGFCEWYDEIKYAPTIIKADKAESEYARGAEITDAYPADWKTVLYCDIEHNCAVSKAQLFDEYKAMVDTGTIDSDETFSDYLANCTSKNGTLVRLQ